MMAAFLYHGEANNNAVNTLDNRQYLGAAW
jgi:hypothetical protein